MSESQAVQGEIRKCLVRKWPDFNGYGFNLHAERGKSGQYVGKVDEGSPADAAGLKDGDRIVEVNDVNIGNENHQQVVTRIKACGDQVILLVVDKEADDYCKNNKIVISHEHPNIKSITCPQTSDGVAECETPGKGEEAPAPVDEAPVDDYEAVSDVPKPAAAAAADDVPSYEVPAENTKNDAAAVEDEADDLPPPPPALTEIDDTPAANDTPSEEPEAPAEQAEVPASDDTPAEPEPAVESDAKTEEPQPETSVEPEPEAPAEPEVLEAAGGEPAEAEKEPEPAQPEPEPEKEPEAKVEPPAAKLYEEAPAATQNGSSAPSIDTMQKMTAAEMRAALAKKKKADPRKENMSAKAKLDMFQRL